ncbi:hypothetical protein OG21DRAFT_1506867 [Imleria badia]|nr:hypothetical protein OG21DRAFT_1506867 [Imleria badia]
MKRPHTRRQIVLSSGKGGVFNVAGKNGLEASLVLSKPPTTRSATPTTGCGTSVTLLTRTKNPSHLVRALYLATSGFWAEEWQRQGGFFKSAWDRLSGKPTQGGVGVSETGDGDG